MTTASTARRSPPGPGLGRALVAAPLALAAVSAVWMLWQGAEVHPPAALALIGAGVAAWLAAVAVVWFGPLPDGHHLDVVGAAMTVSALSFASIALGAIILLAEIA